MASSPVFIGAEETSANLVYEELIPAVEAILGNYSLGDEGGIQQPVRNLFSIKDHNGFAFIMPAYSRKDEAFVTKIVTFYPENEKKGIPGHQSLALLYDAVTGSPKAIIDAEGVTNKRTAAASAVATKYLAPKNARVYAVLGAGNQAVSHLEAIPKVCSFDEIRIWNRTYEKAEALAKKYRCKVCRTAEEAVQGADVISTTTSSSKPVLDVSWVKPGAHVNCVGAPVPTYQELDPKLMQTAVIYVDSRGGAIKESGDVILSKAEIYAEIGEVINGSKQARREETTVFKSLGMAVEDLVSCKLVYSRHAQANRDC